MSRLTARTATRDPALPANELGHLGLRVGIALLLCLLAMFADQNGGRQLASGVMMIILFGLVGTAIHGTTLLVPAFRVATPWTSAAADAVLLGGLAYAARGELELTFTGWLLLAVSGLIHTSLIWSAGQIVSMALAGGIGAYIALGPLLPAALSQIGPIPLMSAALGIGVIAAAFALDRVVGVQRRRIAALEREKAVQALTTRERMRALYELAYSMSDSIRFDRILQTALDAGVLGVNHPEQGGPGLVAAVMLFHADDNLLHVVAARRFSKPDEGQTIPGKDGIVGEALREVEPTIGTNGRRDPELQYFSAFQYCKSILVIPLHSGYDNFGVIVYGSEQEHAFSDEHREVLSAIGLLATVGLQNALLYQSLLEEKERLVEVEEDARKKLARDLHDGPTQSISAIAMRVNYILRLHAKSPEKVPDELRKVEEIARKTTREIRHMLFTLRPLVLETQGISAALQQLAEKVAETHGQAVQVRVGKDIENALDRMQQGVIFYIIEEAINNARKHAQASLIQVTLSRQDNVVVVKVADNGRGFDTQSVNVNYDQRGSLGMINMRERAELIEGRLNVESVPGRGTVITVIVPLRTGLVMPQEMAARAGTTKIELAAAERLLRRDAR
ncbi:MAG: histidine kinase [Candidatus Flexifilum sp.]|jgi:signal transduction histidine kinase